MKKAFSPQLNRRLRTSLLAEITDHSIAQMNIYERRIYLLPVGEHPVIRDLLAGQMDVSGANLLLSRCPLAVIVTSVGISLVLLRAFGSTVDVDTTTSGALQILNELLGDGQFIREAQLSLAVQDALSTKTNGAVTPVTLCFAAYVQIIPFITDDERMRAVARFIDRSYFYAGSNDFISFK